MKSTFNKLIFISLSIIFASGCAYNAPQYGVSAVNVETLRSLNTTGQKFTVNKFTSTEPGKNSIGCRAAGPITTPNKEPFEDYITSAFISELQLAGLYEEGSNVTIDGKLEKIDFESMGGSWSLTTTVTIGDTTITTSANHPFKSAFSADKGCQKTAQALSPAVQTLISKIVSDPKFQAALKAQTK